MSRREKRTLRQYEEKLAEQERLLTREQSERVITALSAECRCVCGVDLEHNALRCYRADPCAVLQPGDSRPFREWIAEYAENTVAESDRAGFLRFADPDRLRKELEEETSAAHRYRAVKNGEERFVQLRFVSGDGEIGMALTDVDRETREELARTNTLNDALAQAEKAGKSDLSFLSRMSHEIRTPMISFGAKDLASDIIAGFFTLMEGSYKVGDFITVGSWYGTVTEIGLRTTKVNYFADTKIFNNSSMRDIVNSDGKLARMVLNAPISYDADLDLVEAILAEELPRLKDKIPGLTEPPQYEGVESLGDSAVNLRIAIYVNADVRYPALRCLNREVKLMFDRRGIEIPYNQIVVHSAGETLPSAGEET